MKNFFGKFARILVGALAAFFGISASNSVAALPDISNEKKALYLEHGKSITRNPADMRAMTHSSHFSHGSRAKTEKYQPVQDKTKATQKINTQKIQDKAKATQKTGTQVNK